MMQSRSTVVAWNSVRTGRYNVFCVHVTEGMLEAEMG